MSLFRLLAGLILSLIGFSLVPAAAQRSGGIAIVGADVLPMTRQERLRDQTVLVEGDRIVRVGARSRVKVPAGYRVINAKGMTLMPGLVDMHIHLSPDPGKPGDSTQRALAVSLAHGVTTARVMVGQPVHPQVRAAVERGEIAGPRIYAGSPPVHQNNTPTPEAARQKVAAAKAAGFDLIKSHQLGNVEVWQAVQDEARKLGIPSAGHVATTIGLDRAMAAGQQIEHLDSAFLHFLPPDAPINFGQLLPEPVMEAALKATDAQYAALAQKAKAAKSHHVPTLSVFERSTNMAVPAEALMVSPDASFFADWILAQWRQQHVQMAANGWTPERGAKFAQVRRRLVRAFHQAGVSVMAGSDTPQRFQAWGTGLLREVETLSAAGLGPMAALRSATVVPRDYLRTLPNHGSALGWKADFGTVEEGARADLILLAGDPSRDIKALHTLRTVIAGGRLYDRAELDRMVKQAAIDGKAQPLQGPPGGPGQGGPGQGGPGQGGPGQGGPGQGGPGQGGPNQGPAPAAPPVAPNPQGAPKN